jgi:hypothetical protein
MSSRIKPVAMENSPEFSFAARSLCIQQRQSLRLKLVMPVFQQLNSYDKKRSMKRLVLQGEVLLGAVPSPVPIRSDALNTGAIQK